VNPLANVTNDYHREFKTGLTTGASQACLGSGVNLPDGATLSEVRVRYKSAAGGNPTFYFIAQRFSTALSTVYRKMAVNDSGTLASVNIPIDPLRIDNNLNSYAFVVCISQSDVFYGTRISYTYNNAGD